MIRRDFLNTALGAAALAVVPRSSAASRAFIDLDPTRPGAKISPLLHGHFIEHLGGVIDYGRSVPGQVPLPELSGSASIQRKTLTLTLVQTRHDIQLERTIRLRGASAKSVKATILTHSDFYAHHAFEAPRTVAPRSEALAASGLEFTVRLAPASVTKLEIELV